MPDTKIKHRINTLEGLCRYVQWIANQVELKLITVTVGRTLNELCKTQGDLLYKRDIEKRLEEAMETDGDTDGESEYSSTNTTLKVVK